MANASSLRILLVADGSGGHLIPALQVAEALAKAGSRVTVWYAKRRQVAPLAQALSRDIREEAAVEIDSIPMGSSVSPLTRLWQCGQLWHRAQRCFDTFAPDVVVGFGGWVSAPVVLAARQRRIRCLLHEQNVVMGRTNRWLAPWVDRIAVSFQETHATLNDPHALVTGLPIRQRIGHSDRVEAAQRFGFDPAAPTLLILGGSQGSRAINHLMIDAVELLSPLERRTWQLVHLTGPSDASRVREAYTAQGVRSWVSAYLSEMEAAYAHADVVVARAGASTIAELARCGLPAVLIPYPYAGAHQGSNARLVEAIGGGLMMEESTATPTRIVGTLRYILADRRLREQMGIQMRSLACDDAAQRLTDAIVELARARAGRRASSVTVRVTPAMGGDADEVLAVGAQRGSR